MRAALLFASFLMPAIGQVNAPIGILRGELLEWDVTATSGDMSVRTPEANVYSCHLDSHTYLERDNMRVGMGGFRVGDKVEVVADRKPDSNRCYARTIRVVEIGAGVANRGYRTNLRTFRSTTDLIFPRGNMTFSGVVLRLNPEMMVLRTWHDGEKVILLRQDTRYMDSGLKTEYATLPVNTRVFVRGGKNLENELEAYQVVWGQISGPH